jgi:predicted metal-dependent phosphoesterase TrpH
MWYLILIPIVILVVLAILASQRLTDETEKEFLEAVEKYRAQGLTVEIKELPYVDRALGDPLVVYRFIISKDGVEQYRSKRRVTIFETKELFLSVYYEQMNGKTIFSSDAK